MDEIRRIMKSHVRLVPLLASASMHLFASL